MEMPRGYLVRPRDRGPLMRPAMYPPMRGPRGPMLDRLRLPPRPPLIRGAPPPFVGRPPGMPPGRPRVLPPGMLPRPPMPPPGALGPPGPRGMLPPPRAMMGPPPPRPLPPEMMDGYMSAPYNKDNNAMGNKMNQNSDIAGSYSGNRDMRNNRVNRNNQTIMPQGGSNSKKPRKDMTKNRRIQPQVVQSSQIPQAPVQTVNHSVQAVHPGMHQMPQGSNSSIPPQQNSMHLNQAPVQKHAPPIQSHFVPSQSTPTTHQNSIRGGRNNIAPRNRGNAHVGNRGNVPMNYPPNVPNQMPPRPGAMMNGPPAVPQPVVQYSNAPPPSYPVPPPQVPMKRAAPPAVNPAQQPVMPPPKRLRYDAPAPSNGYSQPASYQPLPPQQQPSYSMNYEMPPPAAAPVQQTTDMYGNMTVPNNTNMAPVQSYSSADYGNYQVQPSTAPSYNVNGNPQYSNPVYTTNQQPYPNSYSSSGYDTTADYSSIPAQTMPAADPYAGYSKPVSTVDSYGYTNTSYNTQPVYDEYSSGYTDNSGYTQTMPAVTKKEAVILMNGGALSATNNVYGDCEDNDMTCDIESEKNIDSCLNITFKKCSDPVDDQLTEIRSKNGDITVNEYPRLSTSEVVESCTNFKRISKIDDTHSCKYKKSRRKRLIKRKKRLQYCDKEIELTALLVKKEELERQLTELYHNDDSGSKRTGLEFYESQNFVNLNSISTDEGKTLHLSNFSSTDCPIRSSGNQELSLPFRKNESNDGRVSDSSEKDAELVEKVIMDECFAVSKGKEFHERRACESSTSVVIRESVHEFDCECLACSEEHLTLLQNFHDTLEMIKCENEK